MAVLDGTSKARIGTGTLCAALIQENAITQSDYLKGMEEVFASAGDLAIDIPQLWDFLPELIGEPDLTLSIRNT